MDYSRGKDALEQIIQLFKKHKLVQNLKEGQKYFCLEFQTKSFLKNGKTQRYFITAYSEDKVKLYNCLIDIHKEFDLNYDFISSISIENFEEYVFNIPQFCIEGKFYSVKKKAA